MAYKLSKYAEGDIRNILTYTLETWGVKQFHAYRAQIEESLNVIAANPDSGKVRKREELFSGCRSYNFGRHVIFFRIKDEILEIVRILHQRMDFGSQIPDEYH